MSFNQKSGKIHERRSSFRQEKKQLYRKPIVVYEQKVQQNSQRETNIESCVHDDLSTREHSTFLLPLIKRDRVEKVDKIELNKQLNMKNRYFTEEREEQNLFTVKQSEKSLKMLKKNKVEPWYGKLKKQQKSIILNYLNPKIQMTKPKKKKRKLKKSISHSRIAQSQQFVWVPSERANQHKRHFSEFKKLKPTQLKVQKKYRQRQSLPHNHWRQQSLQQSIQNPQISTLQRKDKLIQEPKKKIQIIEKYHIQDSHCKRLPFTENIKSLYHPLHKQISSNRKPTHYQSVEMQNDCIVNMSSISQTKSISQRPENQNQNKKQKQREVKIQRINSIKKDKKKIGQQVKIGQRKQQKSFEAKRCDSQDSISIINKGQLKETSDHNESREQSRFQYSHTSIQSRVLMHSYRPKYLVQQTQLSRSGEKQKQDAKNLKIWSEKQNINLEKQPRQRLISSQTKKNELKSKRSNVQVEKDTIKYQSMIGKNSVYRNQVKVQKQENSLESLGQSPEMKMENKFSEEQTKKQQSLSCIPDKQFLKLKTYYARVDKKISKQKSFPLPKVSSFKMQQLKKLPSKEQLITFIQKYTCQNVKINITQLMRHQNFKILLEESKYLYFGLMENNKKENLGVMIRPNYLFEGLYKDGQKFQGVQINQVGKYIGEFSNNKRQGRGEFIWKNGEHYNGDWLNGKKHGNGVWSSPNGDLYIGQWVDGKVEGQGIHSSKNGQHYEGSFHQYLKSGWGKQTLPNGDTYEGQFLLGKPHGRGIYTWRQGQTYQGDFVNSIRQGAGILRDLEGNIYMGHFNQEQALWLLQDQFIEGTKQSID